MSAPPADRVASIAAELGLLGRRLDDLGAELLALRVGAPQAPDRQGEPPAAPARPPAAPARHDPGVPYPGPPHLPAPASFFPQPGTWQPAGPPPPYAGVAGAPAAVPMSSPGPPAAPQHPGPYPGRPPGPPAYPPGGTGHGYPASPPTRHPVRQWLASLSGARLLAWTGAAVTLLGVVLLLALAAARGWFAPPVRVGAGAVLGLALVGLGMRLHRRAASRVGALAVTGTGIATLYLVVAAATARYGYLPVPVGLLLALLVAAAGLGLADRWCSMLLGAGAVVGAALLAPVVTEQPTPLLVALVLVLQAAATVVALRRGWPVLVGIAAGWPVLYGIAVAGLAESAEQGSAAAATAGVLVLGLAAVLAAGRFAASPDAASPDAAVPDAAPPDAAGPDAAGPGAAGPGAGDRQAGDTGAGTRSAAPGARPDRGAAILPRGLRIGLVVAVPVPALAFAAAVGGWAGAALAFLAAVLLLATAAVALRGADHAVGVAGLAAGAVALFEAAAVALDGNAETAVLLGQGVVLLAVAGVLRSRSALVVAGFFAAAGVFSALAVQVPPSALASHPAAPFVLGSTPQPAALLAAAAMSALVLAAAVTALVASARVGVLGADARAAGLWVPVGLVGLYGAAGLVVAPALLASPTRSGFVVGHAVVTVSWIVVALVLLARGIRRPALRMAGLVLVAVSVAKLVLFDLVALDGLARVAAFLGAGLLLLAAGTRYARLVAEAEAEPGTAREPEPQARA